MKFDPQSKLRRLNNIIIELESAQIVKVTINGETKALPNHVLQILDVFREPISVRDAMEKLNCKGIEDWIVKTGTIKQLISIGALTDYEECKNLPDKNPASFGAIPIHIAMLNDRTRTSCFIEALKETVRPGDIVLDIGTGTGVLAIAAARAGAAKVYAVEAGAMADVAQQVIEQSDVADKIVLMRGWSAQIELPELADVLVSEIIGNDPFAEKILQTFNDAKKRLLKPNARVLPGNMQVYAQQVLIPPEFIGNRVLKTDDLKNWQQWYNTDFSALKMHVTASNAPLMQLKTQKSAKLSAGGEPALLYETDFNKPGISTLKNTIPIQVEKGCNGVLMYFVLKMGSFSLTNNPKEAGTDNHWLNPVWHFPQFEQVEAGETINIKLEYRKAYGTELSIAPSTD